MKSYIILAIALMLTLAIPKQSACRPPGRGEKLAVAFYNLENLYDTVPSLFYNDGDYTPTGKNCWSTDRYTRKLTNLARVIDDMSADVLGIAEVESEQAVKELVTTLGTDYNYIHRTTSDHRGMDIALLYKGDKFLPETVRQISSSATREFLYVRGSLMGERIDIVVCHLPSAMNSYTYRAQAIGSLRNFVDSLQRCDFEAQPIVMGDFNANPTDRVMRENFETGKQTMDGMAFMYNPLHEHFRKGFGSYVYDGKWCLYDNIFLSTRFINSRTMRYLRGGIYIRDYMLGRDTARRRGYPLRTFSGGTYLGGYSDHLPVFVYLERER